MESTRKAGIRHLLKGIETGEPSSVEVINPDKYIQHNPQTHEGREGLAQLFKRLSLTNPRVNIVRIFEDGEYVFAHTEYDFSNSNIGFEVFRFEQRMAVEHWDNIQRRKGPNDSGHNMVSGSIEVKDLDKTEDNRIKVESYVTDVLIEGNHKNIENYIGQECFIQHNPQMRDGRQAVVELLKSTQNSEQAVRYVKLHRVLAEGNYALAVCEGYLSGNHSSIYDLYRVENGKLVEHWDTIETIPSEDEWKNSNGKF